MTSDNFAWKENNYIWSELSLTTRYLGLLRFLFLLASLVAFAANQADALDSAGWGWLWPPQQAWEMGWEMAWEMGLS